MPDLQIQRWENQTATGEIYPADVWIEDTKIALGEVMSQCKEWWSTPELETWCVAVRGEAANVVAALERLQAAIKRPPEKPEHTETYTRDGIDYEINVSRVAGGYAGRWVCKACPPGGGQGESSKADPSIEQAVIAAKLSTGIHHTTKHGAAGPR